MEQGRWEIHGRGKAERSKENRGINKKSAEKLQTDWRAGCKKNIYRRLCVYIFK